MEKKKLKTKYAKVKTKPGIVGNSIVTSPAIGEGFLAFSEENQNDKLNFSSFENKQRLIGPILIPNIEILRKDPSTGEYYNLVFSEKDIVEINLKRQINKLINKYNFEHDPSTGDFQNNEIIDEEVWIIKDSEKDQSNFYGLNFPVGTLMSIVHIPNKELYTEIVQKYKGFSIEAYFDIVDEKITNKKTIKLMEKNIFAFLSSKIFGEKNEEKQKFDLYSYLTQDGKEVIIDTATMSITIDGEIPADGDYTLEDGTVISVASGLITNIVEATQPSDQTQQADVTTQPTDQTQPSTDVTTQPTDSTDQTDSTSATTSISVEIEVELSKLKEEKLNFETEIQNLKNEIVQLNAQIELYKKHQRAQPKIEVLPSTTETKLSKNDLIVNRLSNLVSLQK